MESVRVRRERETENERKRNWISPNSIFAIGCVSFNVIHWASITTHDYASMCFCVADNCMYISLHNCGYLIVYTYQCTIYSVNFLCYEEAIDEFIYDQEQHKKYCIFITTLLFLENVLWRFKHSFCTGSWTLEVRKLVTVQYVYHLFCENIIYFTKYNCAIWICCSTYLCYRFVDIFSLLNIVTFGRTILVTAVLVQWFTLAKNKVVHNLEGFFSSGA